MISDTSKEMYDYLSYLSVEEKEELKKEMNTGKVNKGFVLSLKAKSVILPFLSLKQDEVDPYLFFYDEDIDSPGRSIFHELGAYYIMDPSSDVVVKNLPAVKNELVLDMCAAPGGKSLHVGDKMGDYGTVDARDISQYKVDLIEENIHRTDSINVQAHVMDATVFDVDSELKADIVIADVPCSGYGVIGKKPEIKYRVTPQKQEEIVILQRTILDRAAEYVKPGGVLVFSTCTIAKEENEENMMWFMNHHPFKLESIDPYLPEELHSETTALGYLQLLPGVHKTDGFFIAKFRRK